MTFTNPYLRLMRLHQPVGIWLLLWPCWWSLALAGEARPLLYTLFLLGAVTMRSAGCIINDMFDRKIDAQVERTKMRPLASGELSMRQASLLLALLLVISLFIALALGLQVVLWAALSMVLVVSYPLMKRITWWPQLFLGFTFNWGALLGWVASQGGISETALLLYGACVFWTLGYDTIYGHQDKKDDARIGVRSTALKFQRMTKPVVLACYAVFFTGLVMVAQPAGWEVVLFALAALHMAWQIASVKLEDPVSCKKIFASNQWLGLVIFSGLILSN